MSAKTEAFKAIKEVAKKAIAKARSATSKHKVKAKVLAGAAAGAVSDEFAKALIDLKEKLREALKAVRESSSEYVSAEIDSAKEKALAKIQTKAEAAIGRIKLIAEERANSSLNPTADGFFGSAEARINQIVFSASKKLDPAQAQIVEQYARQTLGRITQTVSASLVSEFDPTGSIEGSISESAEKASVKAAQSAAEAIAELAIHEARKVDVYNVTPDEEIPAELRKKSTKALRAILRNMEQGDFQTRWTPGQVKGAIQLRESQ